jgi:cation diffusion facilitator CzcD-associated flavoprotein CzcO
MVEAHFTPRYNPWDERVCLVPDGDLFKALRSGKASVVTGEIETVTPEGIRLKDGTSVEADILVTATGLKLAVLSDIALSRDGHHIDLPETYSYKGMMFSGVPNLVQTFGYINASWTLRADLTSDYVARLLRHMKDRGFASVTPTLRPEDANMPARPWIDDFSPGYMQREMHRFPKQGTGPWRNTQDFATDKRLAAEPLEADRVLVFETPKAGEAAVQAAA